MDHLITTNLIGIQEDHALKLEKLVIGKENVTSHLDSMREVTDNKRENISKMAAQALALREKGAEYILSSQINDSRTAYALSLYMKISNINWDYDAPPGKIAGCKFLLIFVTYSKAYFVEILSFKLTIIAIFFNQRR